MNLSPKTMIVSGNPDPETQPWAGQANAYMALTRYATCVCGAVTDSPFLSSFLEVERRRRFNINDRIKELGTLIPKSNDP